MDEINRNVEDGNPVARVEYIDGKWVKSDFTEKKLETDLSTLNDLQLNMISRRIIHRDAIQDDDAREVFDKYIHHMGEMLRMIKTLRSRYVSTTNGNLKYTCNVTEGNFGTSTSFAESIDSCVSYLWGVPSKKKEVPDLVAATAESVLAFAKPTETGYDSISLSKSEALQGYFPKDVVVGQYAKTAAAAAKSRVEALGNISAMMDNKLGSKQIVSDMVKSQPAMLSYGSGRSTLRSVEVGDVTYVRKGYPTRVDVKGTPFATLVQMINVMSSAFGTKKYSFGRLCQSSYDGLANLEGAARERHEHLTDFIDDVKVDVYLLRTRDANLARALYREISKGRTDGEKYIVVYDGIHTDSEGLKKVCVMEDKIVTKLIGTGVVCVSLLAWQKLFSAVKTYYISWKSYKKGKGKGDQLLTSSYAERMYDVENASGFTHYAYYGFIGAMGEEDKAVPSCKGRHGTVIFTNARKGYNRAKMGNIVFNTMHHALLYPWLNSPYMYISGKKFFFDGVRAFKTDYDFSRKNEGEKFVYTEIPDETVDIEEIDKLFDDLAKEDGTINEALKRRDENRSALVARRNKASQSPTEKEEEKEDDSVVPDLGGDMLANAFQASLKVEGTD